MRPSRRGFTLIEILVALVLFGIVEATLTRLLITSQRVTTAQTVRATLQSNLRVGSMVVPNELRMLNQSDTTDILSVSDTSIVYLAMRGYYVLCSSIGSATSFKVVRVPGTGFSFVYREPAAGDSLFIFYENDTLKMSDDKWVRLGLSGTASTTCDYPAASTAALTFTLGGSGIPAGFTLDNFLVGAPVRTYEVTRLAKFTSGGQSWLGMCTGSATCTLQPVLGPLAPTGGFVITRYNDAGSVVAGNSFSDRNSLRSLKIQFVGVSESNVSRGVAFAGGASAIYDTLITFVTLRNVKQN
ncbi:MAG TPA: type II secretion system protein [Gemmatimonadales bacterium]|nr:type II secretion system protein [Gemmatimonadales bacterium]